MCDFFRYDLYQQPARQNKNLLYYFVFPLLTCARIINTFLEQHEHSTAGFFLPQPPDTFPRTRHIISCQYVLAKALIVLALSFDQFDREEQDLPESCQAIRINHCGGT